MVEISTSVLNIKQGEETKTIFALEKAKTIDEEKSKGKEFGEFAGIPIGIKDNMCTKGVKTTCSSKMLENFVAPYNATAVEKLNEENLIDLGKLLKKPVGKSGVNYRLKKIIDISNE